MDAQTTYLVMADLACSGVVEDPTGLELGRWMFEAKRPSFQELVKFSLALPPRTENDEAMAGLCADAFQQLYQDVAEGLAPEDATALEFSPVLLEHILSKYGLYRLRGLCNWPDEHMEKWASTVSRARHAAAGEEGDSQMDDDE